MSHPPTPIQKNVTPIHTHTEIYHTHPEKYYTHPEKYHTHPHPLKKMSHDRNDRNKKCNYKGIFKDNLKCEICKFENDTTEHLLKCTSNESIQNNVDNLNKPDNNVVKIIEQNISKRESLGYKVKGVHRGGLKGRSFYLYEVIYAYSYLFTYSLSLF